MNLVTAIDELKNSTLFFQAFSRLEFAIKKSGALLVDPNKDIRKAEVDWVAFSNSLPEQFFREITAKRICPTIISAPPKQQIVDQGKQLLWRDTPCPQNSQMLFECLRNIRNNLFHGGKYGDPDGLERNETLITEAIQVIGYALEARGDLERYFTGQA